MTADWPAEAREAVARAVAEHVWGTTPAMVNAVLAALDPYVQPRTDDWEWGLQRDDSRVDGPASELLARRVQSYDGGTVVRRRPAGEWEVAP